MREGGVFRTTIVTAIYGGNDLTVTVTVIATRPIEIEEYRGGIDWVRVTIDWKVFFIRIVIFDDRRAVVCCLCLPLFLECEAILYPLRLEFHLLLQFLTFECSSLSRNLDLFSRSRVLGLTQEGQADGGSGA
eukprot:scaffold237_cov117-Isochrysis_galbana.AAC.1